MSLPIPPIPESREEARKLLISMGLLTPRGEYAPAYGGPPYIVKASDPEVRARVLSRFRLGVETKAPRGAGNYVPGVCVMLVGERTSHPERNKYHAPFCSTKACSGWLNAKLEERLIDERRLFWINALDNDGTPIDLHELWTYLKPRHVLALGKVAEQQLAKFKVPVTEAFSHPQYWKRFKHREEYPLVPALEWYSLMGNKVWQLV